MLLGIASLVFFIIHIAPGDPLDMLINQYQRNVPSPETIEAFRIKYGLDQPIHIQYFNAFHLQFNSHFLRCFSMPYLEFFWA